MAEPAVRTHLPRVGHPVRRQRLLSLGALAILLVFVGRLVMVQGVNAAELSEQALATRLTTTSVSTERADIVDRNGVVLATSVQRYNVYVDQTELAEWKRTDNGTVTAQGPLDAAKILAPILGMSESELAALLVGDATFKYIAKSVTPETWQLIDDEGIYGIGKESVSDRIYPNGTVAGNVVGFMGGRSDQAGLFGNAGIELALEDTLVGEDGSITYERGVGGTVIPTGILDETAAQPGDTVVLTIDSDIQYQVQQILDTAVSNTGSSAGIVIVEDVKTGEIYALADSDTVDPNDPGASAPDDRGSRAVSTVFEPGSTAKVITMAAAIEEGVATPTSQFVAPYEYTTANGQTFHDSHDYGDQKLTLAGILVNSSNTGTIQVGQQLDLATRYKYLSAFGFGTPTDVGLPGESGGILHDYSKWDGRTEYAVLYGQGVSVTALQTAQVYQTIANGGVRVQPTVVSGYKSADGTFTPRDTDAPTQVVSEETASELMRMLEDVTAEGTGGAAQITGYRVAGKTGTAQVIGSDGTQSGIVASFVGIAPADDPRIVVSVIMFDPKTSIWGGTVAAPVFRDVATLTLQSLGVAPSTGQADPYPTTWE
ncbi:penicillin-binding protein 2 [Demequina capsici]|uniref:Penicillin-binding protein 2 n=1 Tax=Demequina capsici TaxID=3075620 RepID=A0AA96J6W0_9MICO|nr:MULTISPECIES: penicillin-binding protein 2 [unclassified Demequina]WNM23353.1 penicillin-binding protein 2 [Demequina sp. OYTSA14]WNM26230.1 penicillin-binding protein 2 [Demequina sp. PMTSA13]